MRRELTRQCPQCAEWVQWPATPTYPFCSERCRLIDLGIWARGDYRIPTDEAPAEDAWAELPGEEGGDVEHGTSKGE
jgi:endogenous inhibitor of DNA gyrase (YacG/DUF329 family)